MTAPGIGLFLFCALIALLSALGTIVVKSPIRAAMSLLVHITALCGLFLTLHAHLLAALQLLVYAGAVVVLFVFVIMMIGPSVPDPPVRRGLISRTTAAALMGLLTFALAATLSVPAPVPPGIRACMPGQGPECDQFGGVGGFSHALFVGGMVPFELISMLLTVAIVGAIAVARGHTGEEAEAAQRRRAALRAKQEEQAGRERDLAAETAASGGH